MAKTTKTISEESGDLADVLDAVRDLADVLKDTLPENHRDAASKVVHEIDKLRGRKIEEPVTESQGA